MERWSIGKEGERKDEYGLSLDRESARKSSRSREKGKPKPTARPEKKEERNKETYLRVRYYAAEGGERSRLILPERSLS